MSAYEKFAKDVGIVGLAQLILALRGLILLPIIAKLLGTSGYGIWAQVIVTLGIAEFLYGMGLGNALVRFLAAETDRREIQEGFYSILSTVVSGSLAIALVLALFAQPISNAVFDGQGTTTLKLAALVIPCSALYTVCSRYFLTFRQTRTYSILNLVRYLGEIGLVAGLVTSGFGVNGAVLSLAIAAFISSILALILIVLQIGIKRPDFRHLKSYLKFGLPIVPLLLFAWITQLSDRYVIGHFLGVASVGIYSAAYTLCGVMGWLHRPIVTILQPTLSKSYDEGKTTEVQAYLGYSLKYVLMLAIPAAIGLSLLGKQILLIFTTSEFASDGYLVLFFVAPSQIFVMVYAVTGWQVLMLTKSTKTLAVVWGIAALVNLGLNLVLVPHFGILAAAGTTLLAYTLGTGITLYLSFRELTFPVCWVFILKSLTSSAAMAGVILLMNPTKIWELILVIALGAVVYVMALRLLRGLTRDEFWFFALLLRRNLPVINRVHLR